MFRHVTKKEKKEEGTYLFLYKMTVHPLKNKARRGKICKRIYCTYFAGRSNSQLEIKGRKKFNNICVLKWREAIFKQEDANNTS